MEVPYNTGKVEIGKYYKKPPQSYMDADAYLLQTALIGNVKELRKDVIIKRFIVCSLTFGMFGYFIFR
jgi:hypothetical protein